MKHANVNGANVGAQFIAPKTANGKTTRLNLNNLLRIYGISRAQLAREAGISRTAMSLAVGRGMWPADNETKQRAIRTVWSALQDAGAEEKTCAQLFPDQPFNASKTPSDASKTAPIGKHPSKTKKTPQNADFGRPVKTPVEWPSDVQKQTGRDESFHVAAARLRRKTMFCVPYDLSTVFDSPKEETEMLLKNETLTAQARQFFKIPRSPFLDDVNCEADVFCTPETEYVRAVLFDAAMSQGFVAVIGESGSGKTTLREELEERCRAASRPVVIIKPYVLEMEASERTGTVLRSGQISEAIVHALDPAARVMRSAQARARQVHRLLTASAEAGNNHLLIIEEAHRMPAATLRHLKGFMEMKAGLRRLLGVALIGQPELHYLLNEHRADLREIVQRCAKVEMPPLDADLEGYIRHKFARVGVDSSAIFNQAIVDAIRTRLVFIPRGGKAHEARSVCYPLIVNNLITRALNAAARVGMALSADVIKEC